MIVTSSCTQEVNAGYALASAGSMEWPVALGGHPCTILQRSRPAPEDRPRFPAFRHEPLAPGNLQPAGTSVLDRLFQNSY